MKRVASLDVRLARVNVDQVEGFAMISDVGIVINVVVNAKN